jgi:hypothetical protein
MINRTWTKTPGEGWHWHRLSSEYKEKPALIVMRNGVPYCKLWQTPRVVELAEVLGEFIPMLELRGLTRELVGA